LVSAQAPAPTESFRLLPPNPAARPAAAAGAQTDSITTAPDNDDLDWTAADRPNRRRLDRRSMCQPLPADLVGAARCSRRDNWPSEHGCDVASQLKLTDRRLTARLPSCRSTATTALYHLLARAAAECLL